MKIAAYLIFFTLVGICAGYGILAITHALKFSYLSKRIKFVTLIFSIFASLLIIGATTFLLSINWENF